MVLVLFQFVCKSLPVGGCWDMLLVPYRDKMESLDRGFLAVSSALVVLLLSLNRSRSPCNDPELATPPDTPAAGACVGVLAELLELTWRQERDWDV